MNKMNFTLITRGTGDFALVSHREECVLCGRPAVFEVITARDGVTGKMCEQCFTQHGMALGTGLGQVLLTKDTLVKHTATEIILDLDDTELHITTKKGVGCDA